MLGVKLICVGKLKEAYWRDAVAEYLHVREAVDDVIELPDFGCGEAALGLVRRLLSAACKN